jgi:hypothetical protein
MSGSKIIWLIIRLGAFGLSAYLVYLMFKTAK